MSALRQVLTRCSLLAAGAFACWTSDASACEPPVEPPLVHLAARRLDAAGPLVFPKNGGIVFEVYLGDMPEETAKAQVSVEVRSGDRVLAGELRTVGTTTRSTAQWQWKAASDLPVGPLEIRVGGEAPGARMNETVQIEDRSVGPMAPLLTVAVDRKLFGDDAAPKIACSSPAERSNGIGSCGRAASNTTIPSRAIVGANVRVTTTASEDRIYFQQTVRMFGRRAGVAGPAHDASGWGMLTAIVDGQFDEYCAEPTTLSFIDGTEIKGATTCIQSTIRAGAPSQEEEAAYVREMLTYCENPVFPEGASADDPTGRGSDGGCALAARPRGAVTFAPIAFGLTALLVFRRRRAR